MVAGVSEGFEKKLELTGVGYRATLKGKDLDLSLGYSHPVLYPAPDNITFEVPDNTHITVKGISKEQVGQVAAEIRMKRPPEPYKGKGIHYEWRAHPQEARQGRQVASRLNIRPSPRQVAARLRRRNEQAAGEEAGLKRRERRVRAKIFGTAERPRLSVHRTNAHIYAQTHR